MTNEEFKKKLLEIYNEYPKHWTRIISKRDDLISYINSQNLNESYSLKEKASLLLFDKTSFDCPYGNKFKIESLSRGVVGCGGKEFKCKCSREQTSKSCIDSISLITKEEKQKSHEKRVLTTLNKYGVTNNGQTYKAKLNHANFYLDQANIEGQIRKQTETLLQRYKVSNARNIPGVEEKIKITNLEKYGVEHQFQRKEVIDKRIEVVANSNCVLESGYYRVLKYWEDKKLKIHCSLENYTGVATDMEYELECMECHHRFMSRLWYGDKVKCKICNPIIGKYSSKEEEEVFEYCKSLDPNCYQTDRKLINPYELDIVYPNRKLAIEYCGLYYHAEKSHGKTENYHRNKLEACNKIGYDLITIFSDEWIYKKDIVKNILRYKLGLNQEKVNARKCLVREIDWESTMLFLEDYHIQGRGRNTGKNYGLFNNNELIAVMTFIKIKDKNSYELVRFASSCSVRGGASKLLSYFIKAIDPETIITYADRRYSVGNLYEKIGFEKIGINSPAYTYTKDYDTRESRYSYQKKNLIASGASQELFGIIDKTKFTEWEIMRNIGFDRIWDCGLIRYKWSKK